MNESAIQALIDREAIRDLRSFYSHHLDGNNISELDKVFMPDALVDLSAGVMRGIDEIRSSFTKTFAEYDRDDQGRYPFLHVVANHWIRMTGPDTAEGRCYLMDFATARKADANPLLLLGLYADEYKRTDDGWRISRSRLEIVWPERNPGGGGGEPDKDMVLPT